MGRRKIEIKRIENKHNRFICFSKRRKGLFNKADELARRGFHIIVLVFSKSGNAFVYGSPNVEEVVNRFLHNSDATNGAGSSNTSENLIKALKESARQKDMSRNETVLASEEVSNGEDESEESARQKDMSRDETVSASKTEERAEENDITRNEMILASEESWDSLNSALTEGEHFWWNSSAENLSSENLLQFKSALEELLNSVRRKADSLLVEQDFLSGFT